MEESKSHGERASLMEQEQVAWSESKPHGARASRMDDGTRVSRMEREQVRLFCTFSALRSTRDV